MLFGEKIPETRLLGLETEQTDSAKKRVPAGGGLLAGVRVVMFDRLSAV